MRLTYSNGLLNSVKETIAGKEWKLGGNSCPGNKCYWLEPVTEEQDDLLIHLIRDKRWFKDAIKIFGQVGCR